MQLNHLHLSTPDVTHASAFFVQHFGFRLREMRGRDSFAVLDGEAGVIFVLMRLPDNPPMEHAYPPMFHIGFLVKDETVLEKTHASLTTDGHQPSDIEHTRGARRFYCKAPGGLLVEVGHEPEKTMQSN